VNIESNGNSAIVRLEKDERFYFKKSILTGYPHFDWCLLPPFPAGGPILRILHQSYFGMRSVRGFEKSAEVPVTGYYQRGNFRGLVIPPGEKHYVNARHLAGFSAATQSISTHIKLHPVFWCLQEHFFTVITGPSTVLLYSPSSFVEREDLVFEAPRVVSFNIRRRITASTVQPRSFVSSCINIFDRTVYLRFLDDGTTLAEAHHEGAAHTFSPREFLLHLLALLKL
jgi:hypothetical protein